MFDENEEVLAWGPAKESGPVVTCVGTVIRLRDPSTMMTVQSWDHAVHPVAAGVNADGRFLITKGEDNRIRVWAIQGFLLAELPGDRATFSRKGDRVLVVAPDGKVRLMRTSEPNKWCVLTDFLEFSDGDLLRAVVDAAFFEDDQTIVAITHNPAELVVLNLGQQQVKKTFRPRCQGNALRGISISEDLRRAVTVSDAYTGCRLVMQIWDLATELPLPIPGEHKSHFTNVDDAGLLVDGTPVWHRDGLLFINGSRKSDADHPRKWKLKRSSSVGASSCVDTPGYPCLLGPVECAEKM